MGGGAPRRGRQRPRVMAQTNFRISPIAIAVHPEPFRSDSMQFGGYKNFEKFFCETDASRAVLMPNEP